MKVERFEDLRIWQEGRQLVRLVYSDFGMGTPANYDFGFRNQIQRAGISIMNNIAEGFERNTDSDFARFLDISKGSSGEVRNMYDIAEDLQYVSADMAELRRQHAIGISKGIAGLSNRQEFDSRIAKWRFVGSHARQSVGWLRPRSGERGYPNHGIVSLRFLTNHLRPRQM